MKVVSEKTNRNPCVSFHLFCCVHDIRRLLNIKFQIFTIIKFLNLGSSDISMIYIYIYIYISGNFRLIILLQIFSIGYFLLK